MGAETRARHRPVCAWGETGSRPARVPVLAPRLPAEASHLPKRPVPPLHDSFVIAFVEGVDAGVHFVQGRSHEGEWRSGALFRLS